MDGLITAFLFLLGIWILIKTIVYGIYEIRKCENSFGGCLVIIFSVATFALFSVFLFIER